MEELVDIYNKNQGFVGRPETIDYFTRDGKESSRTVTLLPMSHVSVNACLEIQLNLAGDFVSASILDSEKTIIPTTISSSTRSNNIAPMPVDDNLKYIASDYYRWSVVKLKKETKDSLTEKNKIDKKIKEEPNNNKLRYSLYLEQLNGFLSFLKANNRDKIYRSYLAIYNYVSNNEILKDLIEHEVFGTGIKRYEDIPPNDNVMRNFIRFNVLNDDRVRWENEEYFSSWNEYFDNMLKKNNIDQTHNGLDYVTGKKNTPLTITHPKGIIPSENGAKLISSNDKSNFTFKGRFLSADEAVGVGYETSQKAHYALKWLISRQANYYDGRYFLAWGKHNLNLSITNPNENDLLSEIFSQIKITRAYSNMAFASRINDLLYKGARDQNIGNNDSVYLMELEDTTPGRLGIVYYQSIDISTYVNKISNWYSKMLLNDRKNNRSEWFPDLGVVAKRINGNNKKNAQTVSEFVRVIMGSQKIPLNILSNIYERSCHPSSFENLKEWELTINTAARLFKTYYIEKEIQPMLNKEISDRNYLFGRLLAVADVLERGVLNQTGESESRQTNAQRYISSFSERPNDTWKIIYVNLQPYLRKSVYASKAQNLIDEIFNKIDAEDPKLNTQLDGRFLIGFSQQRSDWFVSHIDEK